MNNSISQWMTETYNRTARQYRADDEIHVTGEDHRLIHELLRSTCAQFKKPISALDVGCGTGRHFHCLRNVNHLIGVDVSPEMLKEAENPVRKSEIQIQKIELRCCDFSQLTFPENSFDLIFCLGVFGNGCSLSRGLAAKFYRWLTPGGILLLDTFDTANLPRLKRFRKMLRWKLHCLLASRIGDAWIARSGWPPIYFCDARELSRITRDAGFHSFSVENVRCQLPQGPGAKLRLAARKVPPIS